MMRLLHTADWHLGKRLERFSRIEEQRQVLDEICQIADNEAVNAVIIAGDIYDTFNPPTEAVELFYANAKRLSADGTRAVIAIAGNHDSPDRITAADPLARECGIILAGLPNEIIKPFKLTTGLELTRSTAGAIELKIPGSSHPLRIILTPYANEVRMRACLGFENAEDELRELLKQHWAALSAEFFDDDGINILIAHLLMLRKNEPLPSEEDGERPILHVGGTQEIFVESIPDQTQYVALGHLHQHRASAKQPKAAYYSGSPLSYSMNEAGQTKSVAIVDIAPGKKPKVRTVDLESGRPLLKQQFRDIAKAVAWLQANTDAYVELTIESETYLTASERRRLTDAHERILAIIPIVSGSEKVPGGTKQIDPAAEIRELFADYFEHKYGQRPNQQIKRLFNEILAGRDE